jgi:hypothetical protein
MVQASESEVFARIRYWKDYRPQAAHVFATDHSLRWFLRKHERELLSAGVLLKLPNGTYVDPLPFSALALRLLRAGSLS